MHADTLTLLLAVAVPSAALAALGATGMLLAARRIRSSVDRAAMRAADRTAAIGRDLAAARETATITSLRLARVREETARLDADITGLTHAWRTSRARLDQLTHGRVGPMVRAMQVAGALARIALLWRTPTR